MRLFCLQLGTRFGGRLLCFSQHPQDQPVHGEEDYHQEGARVKELCDGQSGIGSGKQAMQGGTKISNQAQKVDGPERLRTDLGPQIECKRHQQKKIETDDSQSHPERTIGLCKRDQDLDEIEGQELVEEQDYHMQDDKSKAQERDMLVEIIGEDPFQDGLEYFNYTWHTTLDTYERILPEDVSRTATVFASVAAHLANRAERLPRWNLEEIPLPKEAKK